MITKGSCLLKNARNNNNLQGIHKEAPSVVVPGMIIRLFHCGKKFDHESIEFDDGTLIAMLDRFHSI
jgi:hypothetical protein